MLGALLFVVSVGPVDARGTDHLVEAWVDGSGRRVQASAALDRALADCRFAALSEQVSADRQRVYAAHLRLPGMPSVLGTAQAYEEALDEYRDEVKDAEEAARAHPAVQRVFAEGRLQLASGAACVSQAMGQDMALAWWDTRRNEVKALRHPQPVEVEGRWEDPVQVHFRQVAAYAGPAAWARRGWDAFVAEWDGRLPAEHPHARLLAQAQARRSAGPVEPQTDPVPPEGKPAAVRDCPDCPPMITLPAGSFLMGSPSAEPGRRIDEALPHPVAVAAFRLARTEVTRGEWTAVMGRLPDNTVPCKDDCPVQSVSWEDAQAYIQRLNQRSGRRYRLPTEAEWEYAARAGTRTAFAFGPELARKQANVFSEHFWGITRVARHSANAWGLRDMHGNVWEWVQDCWADPAHARADGAAVEREACDRRVRRGGASNSRPALARSASRVPAAATDRLITTGFRLAEDLP